MKVKARATAIVDSAREYLGYTARPQSNIFATRTGYNGSFQWDGSFVEACIRDAGITDLPSHANSLHALAFYIRNGLTWKNPKIGDIVFFSYGFDGQPLMTAPRIGIVTDVSRWKVDSAFKSIEGQVSSGAPKAPQDANGVYERTRYATDVLAFARPCPTFKRRARLNGETLDGVHIVRPAHLERCTTQHKSASADPTIRRSVELVQLALASHPNVRLENADRAVFNGKTRSALASFQRFLGLPPSLASGKPDAKSLLELANSPSTVHRFGVDA
jgi:hypothetical protein